MLLQELIVHPRDLLTERSRAAVARAVASSALDLVQLRTAAHAADEQEAEEMEEDAVAAGRVLRLLLDRHHGPRSRPALVVNAPLARARTLLATPVRFDGWHLKERELAALRHGASASSSASAAARGQLAWLQQRRQARTRFWVGCSVHSVEAAVAAARLGVVDYLQVGTMFPTASHPDKLAVEGPQLLPRIRAALAADEELRTGTSTGTRPGTARTGPALVAVGGIATADQVREVMAAGADGIAVIRAVLHADDPRDAATRLRVAMEQAAGPISSAAVR